ncbi:hypothetical protein XELAEV_18045687mg [Xenopus laevis]|uniref:Uncharacterized protein n=1 Tax=Xenopus laevis TaxID=8355 RepID=A0A974C122_XENLA|nr:hypothetical protein XELAEV_18045687mg [Xenopus laevis]
MDKMGPVEGDVGHTQYFDRYQHILEQNQPFTRAQAQTELEVYTEYNYLPMIIGSSVGGLVLLALITAALYKVGFFKRQYKELMESPEGQTVGGEDTTTEAQTIDVGQ